MKNVFSYKRKMTNSSQKSVKIVYFFKSTDPEMQRKHITRVYEYQLTTSSHLVDD